MDWGDGHKVVIRIRPKFKKYNKCGKPLKNGGWCGKKKNHWFRCHI